MPLFSWQEPVTRRIVEILRARDFCLNTSDCGTGKTFMALEAASRLQLRVLVWTPKSVVGSWWAVAESLGVRDQVLDVVNPERIALGKTRWFQSNRWRLEPGTLLVVDEPHRGASGVDSRQTKVLAQVKAYGTKVLAQSATIADSPLKLRAIGFLAGCHEFNPSSFYGWCRRHGCFNSPWHSGIEFPKGPKGRTLMAKVHQELEPSMVRIRIQDVPEFPETSVQPLLVTLPDRDTQEFQDAYRAMDARLKEPGANQMVEVLRARQRTEHLKVPYLGELIRDDLEAGNAVVVLVQFRDTLAQLAGLFPGCSELHGDQTQEERNTGIERFQSGVTSVICGIASAGGIGVSLHDLDGKRPRVAYHTPGWSASEFRQACGRVHRAGGTKSVQHVVLCSGTIEERVYRTLLNKQGNIDTLQDGDLT